MNDERDIEEREESSEAGAEEREEPGEAGVEAEETGAREAAEDGEEVAPGPENHPALAGRRPGGGRLTGPRRGRLLVKKADEPAPKMTPEHRLLVLDTWKRSSLPAGDFAPLVGLSKHTLYEWKRRFEAHGPAGLMDGKPGREAGSRVPELTRRTIVMLKETNPTFGCERISDLLARGPALPASATTVARVLREEGYELEEAPTRPHPDKMRHFERAVVNELWQTDLFTFVLKRQNRRVHLVGFMDDHSRFIVGYGLHATASTALVLEALRAAITSYGTPKELLTDNGSQYVTWRGKSAFSKELEQRGVRQIVARPRHPQTLGKIERFWGTLWRECVETTVFVDLEDARQRIGHFIDHYNFHRPHQGIDGLVPADRYFGMATEVRRTLEARVAKNALELARNGAPKEPFYLTGQAGGRSFAVHAQGERVYLTRDGEPRQEIDLSAPPPASPSLPEPAAPEGSPPSDLDHEGERAPGTSPLDEGLAEVLATAPWRRS